MKRIVHVLKAVLEWVRRHKVRVMVLVLLVGLGAPNQLKSQILDPCCALLTAGLTTISNTLSSVIGGGLNNILSVDQEIRNFEQSVVWPQTLINEARSLVASMQGTFNRIQGIVRTPVNSATLPATQQLEQNLLSGDPNQMGQTNAQFVAVYGAVPDSTAASPQTRNLLDMNDAAAQEVMQRAIAADAIAALELQAADRFNQSIQTAAPGSAPIIEAQAQAWVVRGNAYTLQFMADRMRVQAIELADDSADVKTGAANATAIQQQIFNLLKRQ
jgi:hypothetical protein